MPTNPDLFYQKSREDLLVYEDVRFNSLLQALCNFYQTRNDNSLWGNVLRAYAIELARLEFDYAYDIVSRQAQFLTPADIKRRWSIPLFISFDYPASTDSGFPYFDLDYKNMIVELLAAFQEGATTQSISDVIFAYTGKRFLVEELYKQIGTFYDQSDRNSIKVSVTVGGTNPLTDIQSLNQLQQVTKDLYGAIDLAKPAHVGVDFTTVFSEGESLDALIDEITDTLRIIVQLVEVEPFNPMLIQAPVFDPANPKTTIAAWGRQFPQTISADQWAALLPKPSYANPNSPSLQQAYHLSSGSYVLGFWVWSPSLTVPVGAIIIDTNGNFEIATVGGITGVAPPHNASSPPQNWPSNQGQTLQDGGVTWLNLGPNAYSIPTKWIMLLLNSAIPGPGSGDSSTPFFGVTGEVSNWDPTHPTGLVAPRLNRTWEIANDELDVFEED